MTNEEPQPDFAQVLADLMDQYKVNGSEVARRIGVHVSTVNLWVHRSRTPRRDALLKLSEEFPDFTFKQLADAAGRKAPGIVAPDRAQRLLKYFEGLTEEQQEIMEIQAKALHDANRQGS